MAQFSADVRPPSTGPEISGPAALLSRPRWVAVVCIVALTASGWAYLLLAVMKQGSSGPAGFVDAICRAVPAAGSGGVETVAIVAAMWVAMTLAMMLPTAGPMILTYAEIAETALAKGERIVSPHVLIGGYLAVWLGFAALATLAQLAAIQAFAWPGAAKAASPISAFLFLAAGLYQFSQLKHACLRACQRPFSFFFLNWTDRASGVFRLGLRQGLYCLGCCWAMMVLMLAAGAMNVVWMALLGVVMLIEKLVASAHVRRAIGLAFTAAGLTLLAAWASGVVS